MAMKKLTNRSKTLQLSKELGEVNIPHVKNYSYSQIKPLINRCNKNYNHVRWKDIELALIQNPPLQVMVGNKYLEQIQFKTESP